MTKKTVKDLNEEVVNLKNENNDMKNMFKALSEKYEKLEKKVCECVKVAKHVYQCNKCGQDFESMKNLRKHQQKACKSSDLVMVFDCEDCGKSFDEKWKLNAHKKNHKKHKCDQCGKTFQAKDIMEKHTKIAHENVKLYCHFFNNEKVCPFEEECIFLHEDSENCRFAENCDRINCMFKHIVSEENDNDENESDENVKDDDKESTEDEKNENEVEVEVVGESLEFTVYAMCRNLNVSKVKEHYTTDLNNCAEVEIVENIEIHSKPEIAKYIKTTIRFRTHFAVKFKNDEQFRKNFWKRFTMRETCP